MQKRARLLLTKNYEKPREALIELQSSASEVRRLVQEIKMAEEDVEEKVANQENLAGLGNELTTVLSKVRDSITNERLLSTFEVSISDIVPALLELVGAALQDGSKTIAKCFQETFSDSRHLSLLVRKMVLVLETNERFSRKQTSDFFTDIFDVIKKQLSIKSPVPVQVETKMASLKIDDTPSMTTKFEEASELSATSTPSLSIKSDVDSISTVSSFISNEPGPQFHFHFNHTNVLSCCKNENILHSTVMPTMPDPNLDAWNLTNMGILISCISGIIGIIGLALSIYNCIKSREKNVRKMSSKKQRRKIHQNPNSSLAKVQPRKSATSASPVSASDSKGSPLTNARSPTAASPRSVQKQQKAEKTAADSLAAEISAEPTLSVLSSSQTDNLRQLANNTNLRPNLGPLLSGILNEIIAFATIQISSSSAKKPPKKSATSKSLVPSAAAAKYTKFSKSDLRQRRAKFLNQIDPRAISSNPVVDRYFQESGPSSAKIPKSNIQTRKFGGSAKSSWNEKVKGMRKVADETARNMRLPSDWTNPAAIRVINATCSDGKMQPAGLPEDIFSRDINALNCHTTDSPDSNFTMDLGLMMFPTDYTLRTPLRNWLLQGSKDNHVWDVLVTHSDDRSLKEPGSTCTWPILVEIGKGPYRFLRVAQNGKNSSNSTHFLSLSGFEVYGTIVDVVDSDLKPLEMPPVLQQASRAIQRPTHPIQKKAKRKRRSLVLKDPKKNKLSKQNSCTQIVTAISSVKSKM
ncbi:E3 ubiquitin-protein ligase HECTD1 [Ditylenchus destructor]|nr:E3 ubiquitin-protein ligase HECTD1 [Ditylenchus destructor]